MAQAARRRREASRHISSGTFTCPRSFGHWPAPKQARGVRRPHARRCAHARGMAIEINTRFLYRDHPDERKNELSSKPTRAWRKRPKPRGVGIAIGSDAHSPQGSGRRVRRRLGAAGRREHQRNRLPGRRPSGARRVARDARTPRGAVAATRAAIAGQFRSSGSAAPSSGCPKSPTRRRGKARIGPRRPWRGSKKRSTGPQRAGKRLAKPAPASKPGGSSRRRPIRRPRQQGQSGQGRP